MDFTASLLQNNIRSYNLGLMFHTMFDAKNGLYAHGSWGNFNDGNNKFDFFGSYYHTFSTEPLLKTGINFSALSFTKDRKTIYFSPERYMSTEVFMDYNSTLFDLQNLRFSSQLAVGLQQIETKSWNTSFRMKAELKYEINKVSLSAAYQTSNVALGTSTGYQFDMFSFKFTIKM
jgi:hypothetical protein